MNHEVFDIQKVSRTSSSIDDEPVGRQGPRSKPKWSQGQESLPGRIPDRLHGSERRKRNNPVTTPVDLTYEDEIMVEQEIRVARSEWAHDCWSQVRGWIGLDNLLTCKEGCVAAPCRAPVVLLLFRCVAERCYPPGDTGCSSSSTVIRERRWCYVYMYGHAKKSSSERGQTSSALIGFIRNESRLPLRECGMYG